MNHAKKDVGSCIVRIDGQTFVSSRSGGGERPAETEALLESAQVDKALENPGMFSLDIVMRSGADIRVLDDLREGSDVEILMGDVGAEKPVFKGEIHYIEPNFRHGDGSTVVVSGYDFSHRLTRGTRSRAWGDGGQARDSTSAILRDVIEQSGDVNGTSDGFVVETGAGDGVSYVPQFNVSDYQFIRSLGKDPKSSGENGSGAGADNPKIALGGPDLLKTPVITLVRENARQGQTLVHEAQFALSTVRQVARVEVRGWDYRRKKAIVGCAEEAGFDFGGQPGWKATGRGLYGRESGGKVLTIVDRPVDSIEEADAVAKSIFAGLSMDFIQGNADFAGTPELSAGDIAEFSGFGKRFDGKYLVERCTHVLSPRSGGFSTKIKFSRNSVGD